MKHISTLRSLLGLTLCLGLGGVFVTSSGCSCSGDGDGDGDGDLLCDESEIGSSQPFRGEWKEVVKTAFPIDGDNAVKNLTIGRTESEGNWGNKGDIEILFDNPDATIRIEVRPYTRADCQTEADDTFDKMYLWAATTSTQTPFKDLDPEDSCIPLKTEVGKTRPDYGMSTSGAVPWVDGCYVYHYFEGQTAPTRSGTDIRVHLPAAYRGEVTAVTEDNATDDDYPLRGDITVTGLCNGGEFRLANGNANIKMCDNLSLAPTCSASQIDTCEAANWAADCGCEDFGKVEVLAHENTGPNITIDFPNSIWAVASVDNEQTGAVPGSPNSCELSVENCDGCEQDVSPDSPWKGTITYNYPGDPAIKGAGYSIRSVAKRCQAVPFVDGPGDWSEGGEPKEDRRGFTRLCTGCL